MNSAIVTKFLEKHAGVHYKNSKKKCLSLDETLDLIFSYLDSEDRASASLVCKQWHRVDGETRKYVSVSNCYAAPPSALSKRFPNVEYFKIKGKPRAVEFNLLVDDWGGYASAWVEEIVRAYPRLHTIHFRRMDVSDNDLKLLAKGCGSALQVLKLDKCSGFSTLGLQFIARSCRSLRTLYLEESEIEDEGHEWLLDLGRNVPGLERLNLASTGIEEGDVNDALVFLMQNCKGLNSLKVGEMELQNFKEIMKHSTIPLLELGTGCYSKRDGVREELTFDAAFIPWVSRLRVLDLKFMNLNAAGHCQLLACCPLLEELEARIEIGDEGLEVVGKTCKYLRRIRIDDQDSPGFITHMGLIAVAEGCRELEFLVMYMRDVTNASLAAVGRCSANLTDFRIVLLKTLEHPEDLPLDEGVGSLLQGCSKLTRFSVYLRPGGLSDRGMSYIGKFGGKLKWILLGCSGDSDQGLLDLSYGCQNLRRLELRGCPFSDYALAQMMIIMKRMKYLWVQGVGATELLGKYLVGIDPCLHVEWMPSEKQLLAYYSLASPRTDTPPTVEILSPTPFLYELGANYCYDLDVGGYDEEYGHEIDSEYC
ncbi:hypothetical protein KC19_1G070600 [Ceratodon purpureus]|uniref:F-box domain-containing protein n=1 Tax=Ceratodon purpureus TaxID=3225 RepID=A0A8T0J4M7_CERPU|nr:hypothetical protein KC19_1G070600 [Ceratodon purpureus]